MSATRSVKWVPRDGGAVIWNETFNIGNVYVGRTFGGEYSKHDSYIIDPNLPVAKHRERYEPANDFMMPYRDMSAVDRRVYLEWLSGYCRDVTAPISFFRRYAGGLYLRLFLGKHDDKNEIIAEARRMAKMLKNSKIPASYAKRELFLSLIVWSTALDYNPDVELKILDEWELAANIPSSVVMRVASYMDKDEPLPANEAFIYARLWTKHKYRPDKHASEILFKKLYQQRFGKGIVVPRLNERLSMNIAMPDGRSTIRVPVDNSFYKMPSPYLSEGLHKFCNEFFEEINSELLAYTRFVNKYPKSAGTFPAVSMLPKLLIQSSVSGRFMNVKTALDEAISRSGVVTAKTKIVFNMMDINDLHKGELATGQRRMFNSLLDKMDIAYEPDNRYGSVKFNADGNVVLFSGRDGCPVEVSNNYIVHLVVIDFMLGKYADLIASVSKIEHALFELRQNDASLDGDQRIRLGAYSKWVASNKGASKRQGQRLAKLESSDKEKVISLTLSAVFSSGVPPRKSMSLLEKFIEKMGGSNTLLHTHMHQIADMDDPVSIMGATPDRGVPIPASLHGIESAKSGGRAAEIDVSKLRELEAETETVTRLLSEIFVEDEIPDDDIVENIGSIGDYDGLDTQHAAILNEIASVSKLSRSEFEELANSHGVLPDGALETINDWAFDNLGAALIFEDDGVVFEEEMRPDLENLKSSKG